MRVADESRRRGRGAGADGVIARTLVRRCAALEALGYTPEDAERIAFAEALAEHGALPDGSYERFMRAHAPERRRRHGVYFTPIEVVEAQVRMAGEALRRIGCDGFGDARVLVVDPATGDGAYPLAVLRACAEGARPRMLLLEALPGAAMLARAAGVEVEQRDALLEAALPEARVMVCIGNPPYRRQRRAARAQRFVAPLVDGTNGIHAKNVHNDYAYFWAWALEHVFQRRRGPGLVSFVTASSYIRGPAFTRLRERLRQALDELWIVDLEGDGLAARRTENVFPIRTPVAIALGVRFGEASSARPARVWYRRLERDRAAKLAELSHVRLDGGWRAVGSDWSSPLTARGNGAYTTWPRLTELFPWQTSGVQMKRTWPIAPSRAVLHARWAQLLASDDRAAAFLTSRDRSPRSSPVPLRAGEGRLTPIVDLPTDAFPPEPVRYAYRSFDRQWLLADTRVGDYMRPALWRSASPRQVFLTSLLTNVLGPGPAAVATALVPDMDCFRGSFGARAVIPLWRDAGCREPNVAPGFLARLSGRYGFEVTPEALLAYCYALLASRGYVRRFDEELRTPGPRVPFTTDADVFLQTTQLGQLLLDVHTYRRVPAGNARLVAPVGAAFPKAFCYDGEMLRLGEGAVAPVRPEVWHYSVSGLAVVRSWLRRRINPRGGRSPLDAIVLDRWTPALSQELLELVWVLEETLRLEPLLEAALDAAIDSSSPGGLHGATAAQQLLDAVGTERAAEDEALTLVAAELFEHSPL